MNLFNEKKDLVLKITNAVLIMWIVFAFIFFYASIANKILPKKELTYEMYKSQRCIYDSEEEYCLRDYQFNKMYENDIKRSNDKQLYISFANILIVSTALILLNRKEGKK